MKKEPDKEPITSVDTSPSPFDPRPAQPGSLIGQEAPGQAQRLSDLGHPERSRKDEEKRREEEKPAAEQLGLDTPGSAASNLVAQEAIRTGFSRPTDGQILTVLQQVLADVGQNERSGLGSAVRWIIARLPNDLKPEPLESDPDRQDRLRRVQADQKALAESDQKERDRQAGRVTDPKAYPEVDQRAEEDRRKRERQEQEEKERQAAR